MQYSGHCLWGDDLARREELTSLTDRIICHVDSGVSDSAQFVCTAAADISCDSCLTPVPQWIGPTPERRKDCLRQGWWICRPGPMTEKYHCK